MGPETSSICQLCCEALPAPAIFQLSCTQEGCTKCLTRWIEKTEATGTGNLPECPYCRAPLTEKEVQTLLGRPFQPKTTGAESEAVVDELTRQWLQQNTKPCPKCGIYIHKFCGCNHVICRCGCRLCYGCGNQQQWCGCAKQKERSNNRVALAREIAEAERLGMSYSAKWLFSNTNKGSLRILKQYMRMESVQQDRLVFRIANANEANETMAELLTGAKWLFCRNDKGSKRMLQQLYDMERVQMERYKRRLGVALEALPQFQEETMKYHYKGFYGRWNSIHVTTTSNHSSSNSGK